MLSPERKGEKKGEKGETRFYPSIVIGTHNTNSATTTCNNGNHVLTDVCKQFHGVFFVFLYAQSTGCS
jgi:hypothetical protein